MSADSTWIIDQVCLIWFSKLFTWIAHTNVTQKIICRKMFLCTYQHCHCLILALIIILIYHGVVFWSFFFLLANGKAIYWILFHLYLILRIITIHCISIFTSIDNLYCSLTRCQIEVNPLPHLWEPSKMKPLYGDIILLRYTHYGVFYWRPGAIS